jgi:hypothetical protein
VRDRDGSAPGCLFDIAHFAAGGTYDLARRVCGRLNLRDGDTAPVEHAPFCAEVILHIDDDHGGLC